MCPLSMHQFIKIYIYALEIFFFLFSNAQIETPGPPHEARGNPPLEGSPPHERVSRTDSVLIPRRSRVSCNRFQRGVWGLCML